MPEETPKPAVPGPKIDTDLSTKAEDKQEDPRQGLPATVNVQQASSPMQLDNTKRQDPNGQYIKYNGVGTVRIMTPQDWKNVGVESDKYFEWNYLNKKQIPRSAFSDEELQYLLRIDGRFELVTAEPKTEDKTTE